MRSVDRALADRAREREGWHVVREGVLVWKRPAAMISRHPPLMGEIRADRGSKPWVCWFRMRGEAPAYIGGSFTSLGEDHPHMKGPLNVEDLQEAFELVESWLDLSCSALGCQHATRGSE